MAIPIFLHSSICYVIWQIFNSMSMALCYILGKHMNKESLFTENVKCLIDTLCPQEATVRQIVHSVRACYKIEVCLKYFWSTLYLFFKYGKAVLFWSTKSLLDLDSIKKTDTSKGNCHAEVRAAQCSEAIFTQTWEHWFSLGQSGSLHTLS